MEQCIEVIRSEKKASVSLLQRRLRLGYGRAARIIDELESRGIVGPSKGAEPHDILIDLLIWKKIFGSQNLIYKFHRHFFRGAQIQFSGAEQRKIFDAAKSVAARFP
jgi:hypothetical protein